MQLIKLRLNNIGPYIGNNEFDFQVSKDKNIILIGGKNGAGKTSLLSAIRIGMFGSYSFGSKSDSSLYQSNLQRLLNYKELNKSSCFFSISIAFRIDEEFTSNDYIIDRKWKKESSKDSIHEEVEVYKKRIRLNDLEMEDLFSKLKELYPPSLIELSLFDGEKIGQIIENQETSSFIRDVFYANFGLNYFDKLDSDLLGYLNSIDKLKLLSSEELDLLELEGKAISIKKELSSLSQLKKGYENKRKEVLTTYREGTRRFSNYGGITLDAKEEIQEFLKTYDNNQKEISNDIRNFLEDEIVFHINKGLISEIKIQIALEKPTKYLMYLDEIQSYLGDIIDIKNVSEKLKSVDNRTEIILDASSEVESVVDSIYEKTSQTENIDLIIERYQDYNEKFQKSKAYRNIIKKNETNSDLIGLLNSILHLEQEQKQLSEKITEIENNRTIKQESIDDLKIRIDILEKTIKHSSNEQNSFSVAYKIQKVVRNFKEEFLNKKLKEIAHTCLEKFVSMTEKKDYINELKISNNFDIFLVDQTQTDMPIEILSAGEKQLLISSLIYAIVKVSNRDIPFIFDTPLARLDFENRQNFIKGIMTDISKQVIILSTDSEIIGETRQIIHQNISREYLLRYGDKNRTRIENGYFIKESVEYGR